MLQEGSKTLTQHFTKLEVLPNLTSGNCTLLKLKSCLSEFSSIFQVCTLHRHTQIHT